MSKFFEAASKLNPLLVESILADTSVPQPAEAAPVTEPAASASAPVSASDAILHAGEFSIRESLGSPVLPFGGDSEDAAEGYKILRTKILQHPKEPKVVCVSSANTGDGKSVTAINIAGVLALKERTRVLLLDCDFRHPTIHSLVGLPEGCIGTADVLAGKIGWPEAILRCREYPNLYVSAAGHSRGRAAELLDSNAWRNGCQYLRTIFDYVVIDSPIGLVADYDLIQDSCDGVVLVARPNHTDRNALQKVLSTVPTEKNLGVVLNCTERWFLWKAAGDYRYAYSERDSNRAGQRRRN